MLCLTLPRGQRKEQLKDTNLIAFLRGLHVVVYENTEILKQLEFMK